MRARVAALIATVLAAPLLPTPAYATETTPPRTGFERSGGARWTSQPEEQEFLAAVDRGSDRVSITRIGTTEQDRPLQLVRIGTRPTTRTVLLICSQHGDEPSGRDACLTTIRDLAHARDRRTERLLKSTTVLVVPTATPTAGPPTPGATATASTSTATTSPSGRPRHGRSPPSYATANPTSSTTCTSTGPHPGTTTRISSTSGPATSTPTRPSTPRPATCSLDHVRPAAGAAGYSTGTYGIWTDPDTGDPIRQVAGDGQERILRNMSGIKHSVGLLIESRMEPPTVGTEEPVNNRRRVNSQLAALKGLFGFAGERGRQVDRETGAARLAGLRDTGPVYVGGADNDPAEPAEVIQDPPCGYRLTAQQYEEFGDELTLHGVRVRPRNDGDGVGDSDGVGVPSRQRLRALVPLLLDERAPYRLTAGEPDTTC